MPLIRIYVVQLQLRIYIFFLYVDETANISIIMQNQTKIQQEISSQTHPPQSPKPEQLQQSQIKQNQSEQIINQEQMPDHFYDSDLASINQKDFLSDNEPPKDQIQQRKLLYKQKKLHVFKTIVRLGTFIDKPARFDKVKLKFKEVPTDLVKPYPSKKINQAEYIHPQYFSSFYLMDSEEIEYNLGKQNLDIERFVTSMKRGETAVFQLEHLQTSKKSGIKLREKVQVFVIGVDSWLTVIDMDCDGKYMKQIIKRGQGHSRINKFDQVSFQYFVKKGEQVIIHNNYIENPVKLQESFIEKLPNIIWKLLNNMKSKEKVRLILSDDLLKDCQGDKFADLFKQNDTNIQQNWQITLQVAFFHSIDDIFLDGQLLKKILTRGVSTAKPQSSSLVYYALKFIDQKKETIFMDQCFDSDWWEDFTKLDELHCRKNYLDDFSVSKMLKQSIKRMKPAQISDIQCRNCQFFQYGIDYQEYKKYLKLDTIPDTVFLVIRVYNFTQGKNCFNMELQQKVIQSKRKKAIGVLLLKQGNTAKALKIFENIVSYYGSGKINQQGYNQKISSLMNSILCHNKHEAFLEVLKLSQQILENPKHGFDPSKLKIKGPMNAKIEGKAPQQTEGDEREDAPLIQNKTIIDKCLYRKAFALTKIGQGLQAVNCLSKIQNVTQQVINLKKQAQKLRQNYQKKSVKMFKNMFG